MKLSTEDCEINFVELSMTDSFFRKFVEQRRNHIILISCDFRKYVYLFDIIN